ncbi:Uncharacterized protein CLAVI_000334 [Candidatus Clavichlamydia salmonicola]|uniref:tetratricopeptide repeat protein n=1 Tax=Candidatus Clavichlamydia salmonicola TaxID=469812 RepID=UPI0018913397|nr:tetratricopeptide repeat protein [Candidatus Clavichlamydia salmonicola]MBF5050716.1 Uncharacterized protein [Candidatus Clavichlamydia salmonicola]
MSKEMFFLNSGNEAGQNDFYKGVSAFLTGDYDEAASSFEAMLAYGKRNPLAYCYLGIIALEKGNFTEGKEKCLEGLEEDPENIYLYYCLGAAFEQEEQWKEAAHYYQMYCKQAPHDTEAMLSMGYMLEKQGKTDMAEICYRKVLALQFANCPASYGLAVLMERSGREEEAMQLLAAATQEHPLCSRLWAKLGALYFKQKLWSQAAVAYQTAMDLINESADGFYNLGLCLLLNGSTKEAEKAFRKALSMNPQDIDTLFYLGLTCLQQQKIIIAENYFMQVLSLDLDYERAHYLLGCVFYKQGRFIQAEKEIDFLTKKNSPYAQMIQKIKGYVDDSGKMLVNDEEEVYYLSENNEFI